MQEDVLVVDENAKVVGNDAQDNIFDVHDDDDVVVVGDQVGMNFV